MSLFGSLQIASNSMLVSQIGLQVTAQNIANVNTPNYSREELIVDPAVVQRFGSMTLGLGVKAEGVVQKIDNFLEERLRAATSDSASVGTQKQVYAQLEQVLGSLKGSDLSTALNSFFSSISDILNQPESIAVRNLAVLQGKNLTATVSQLSQRVNTLRSDQNNQVISAASDINRLISEISGLNVKVAQSEASDFTTSDAVGMRDQRNKDLADLSQLIDIRAIEQPDGSVNVFSGGDFLVLGGITRKVDVSNRSDRGINISELQLQDAQSKLTISSGRVAGLVVARDDILGGFADQLDNLSRTLAFEFNKVFSSGQGLKGYQSATSERTVDAASAPLDAAGLPFTPVNGSFQVQVYDRNSNTTQTKDILVKLNGLPDDTTLDDLVSQLSTVPGLTVSVTPTRQLQLKTNSATQEFAFANDTSGILAALGIGTFFSGSSATGLSINQAVATDPSKFAASDTGIGAGTGTAQLLATFLDRPLDTADGQSLNTLQQNLINGVTEASASTSAAAQGFDSFKDGLKSQQLAVSGVNLDEEVIQMMTYQHMYQMNAKFISTINELLDVLAKI